MVNKNADKIILIMTDTQRTDMLGCYGNPDMKTPNIDNLAGGGMRFDRAYTTQPVCGPARSSIFTGEYPHSNGVYANSMALNQLSRTIGQRMQDKGFHTAYIGKWHLDGGDYFGYGECPDGWDENYWYDMRCYLEELSDEDRQRSRRLETAYDSDFSEDFTYAYQCSSRAVDFLEKYNDEDFFLVVSYDEPHEPSLCPPDYIDMYKDYEFRKSKNVLDTLDGKPEHQRIWGADFSEQNREEVKIKMPAFFGCNTFVDNQIGRVIDAIDEYASDALVIYISDHGKMLQSHCLDLKGPVMYDEIARTPFIVRWPGVIAEDSIYSHPVSHINIVPTIMDAAGFDIPATLQGRSIMEAFINPDKDVNGEVFMEFGRYEIDHDGFGGFQPVRSVFDGRYKLVINLLTSDELYDLEQDPEEINNLIDSKEHRERRNKLHDKILEWMNETRDPFRGYYWERRPWRDDAPVATWAYTGMTRQRKPDQGEKRQLDYNTGLEMKKATRKK